jgi:hypothetical protein
MSAIVVQPAAATVGAYTVNDWLIGIPENMAWLCTPGGDLVETNSIQALRRLAKQADAQISAQLEMIDGLIRADLPTDEAEVALSAMRRTAAGLHARLKVMTAA